MEQVAEGLTTFDNFRRSNLEALEALDTYLWLR